MYKISNKSGDHEIVNVDGDDESIALWSVKLILTTFPSAFEKLQRKENKIEKYLRGASPGRCEFFMTHFQIYFLKMLLSFSR